MSVHPIAARPAVAGVVHAVLAACCCAPLVAQEPAPAASAKADWPVFRGDPELRGVAAGSLPSDLELAWTYATGGAIVASPIVHGGVVYVGSSDQKVHAVDLATGAERWTFATDDMIEAPALWLDGRIWVGSADGFLYVLDAASGELAFRRETGDKILGGANAVRLADGSTRVVVGSYDSKLYSFDAASGEPVWSYATANYVHGTPAILDGKAVFGGCDAHLHLVDVATGEGAEPLPLGDECHVAGSVGVADGVVYFGHYGNAFLAVDVRAEKLVWSYPSPSHAFFSSPAITADRVLFGGRDRALHCVARADGKPLWKFATRRKVDGSPVVCGDKVVFGSGDGRLYLLRLDDGEELWRYELGRSVFSSPAVVAGQVVVGCDDGRLYAFRGTEDDR